MKYFDIVVLIHRNNAENDTENKVVIITVIIITSACFLYFPSHFILGIKTNHNNSCKTAFPWLQLVLRFFQIALAFPMSVSRVFCAQVLSIAGNHQKVYSPPPWGRFPVAVLPMSLVTVSMLSTDAHPRMAEPHMQSTEIHPGSVLFHKWTGATG